MLRITLDINGLLIGEVGVWNRQEYNDEGEVRYSVYDLQTEEAEHIEEYEHLFDVWHHRAHGAASLTSVVMDELSESTLDNSYRD